VLDHESRVFEFLLAAHPFEIALPALPYGGLASMKSNSWERNASADSVECARATIDVVRLVAIAFQQEVSFADGRRSRR